jgi:sugar lactone lactonase YvrE
VAGGSIHGLGFPEALRWRDGALWCSDMFRSRVLRWEPGAAVEVVLDPEGGGPVQPGGLGWLPDGTLLVVDCLERRVLAVGPGGGALCVHADLAAHIDRPANDMHVDPDGTAWVGSYGFDPATEAPRPVALLRVDPDGSVKRDEPTFVFPNGMERDSRGALVVAETFADRLTTVAPDGTTGSTRLPPGSGPDGLSIGPDGTIYVALAFGGGVVAVAPSGGGVGEPPRVVHRAGLIADGPAAGPLAVYDCAVTPDGRWLAVASASVDEDVAMRHDTGRIELIDLAGAS